MLACAHVVSGLRSATLPIRRHLRLADVPLGVLLLSVPGILEINRANVVRGYLVVDSRCCLTRASE